MFRSVVPDARGVFEDRGRTRNDPGFRLAPEDSGLGDVLGARSLQRHPGMEESSLLEDQGPALGNTDVHCSPRVGAYRDRIRISENST